MPIAVSRIQADSPKLTANEVALLEQFRRKAEHIAAGVRQNGGDLDSAFRELLKQAKPTPVYSFVLHFCGMKRAALLGVGQEVTPVSSEFAAA